MFCSKRPRTFIIFLFNLNLQITPFKQHQVSGVCIFCYLYLYYHVFSEDCNKNCDTLRCSSNHIRKLNQYNFVYPLLFTDFNLITWLENNDYEYTPGLTHTVSDSLLSYLGISGYMLEHRCKVNLDGWTNGKGFTSSL